MLTSVPQASFRCLPDAGAPQNLITLHRSGATRIAAAALARIQEEEKQKAALRMTNVQ
jgi:hypothetical protein